MFSKTTIRGITFEPALFCAPLASVTHSAFRRLVADFGGCGGQFTEMLAARQVLTDDLKRSPYLRRRPEEKRLVYQLMIKAGDPVDEVVGRLAQLGPDGLDINLACYAPVIRKVDACSRLFENAVALATVLQAVRRAWSGLLTVKIRLGHATVGAEDRFIERLRVIEEAGVDAITLHVRFFEDKFKRRARHELFQWATSLTRLPIIANGDITSSGAVQEHRSLFEPVAGLMVGRMAIAQPWVFAAWNGAPMTIDYAEVWRRLHAYISEDFQPDLALRRVKLFTKYYARNFHFGHNFNVAVSNAPTLAAARERADAFFAGDPPVHAEPSLMGL